MFKKKKSHSQGPYICKSSRNTWRYCQVRLAKLNAMVGNTLDINWTISHQPWCVHLAQAILISFWTVSPSFLIWSIPHTHGTARAQPRRFISSTPSKLGGIFPGHLGHSWINSGHFLQITSNANTCHKKTEREEGVGLWATVTQDGSHHGLGQLWKPNI